MAQTNTTIKELDSALSLIMRVSTCVGTYVCQYTIEYTNTYIHHTKLYTVCTVEPVHRDYNTNGTRESWSLQTGGLCIGATK